MLMHSPQHRKNFDVLFFKGGFIFVTPHAYALLMGYNKNKSPLEKQNIEVFPTIP